jgi:Rad3-related DNA helicase
VRKCPFCDQTLAETDTESCSHCQQSFEPVPLHLYGKPAEFLQESLTKVRSGSMTPDGLKELFPHLLGSVQHILNQASSDISSNFHTLSQVEDDVPEEAKKNVSEFIADFGEIQEELNDTLGSLSDLFGRSTSLEEFQENSQDIEQALLEIQSSVDALGMLKHESEISTLAEIQREPLPDEVGHALDHFEKAMDALIRYMEEDRDVNDLSECVEQTDKAKAKLFKLVMMNSMGS